MAVRESTPIYWDSVRVGRREKNEPDGSWVYQSYHFSLVTALNYTVLAASMPLLDDNLAFYIRKRSDLPSLQSRLAVIQGIPHSHSCSTKTYLRRKPASWR